MSKTMYVIMCCGGFPKLNEKGRVDLADWPDELEETDFFSSIKSAEERVLALRRDRNYKYEDFNIMKFEDLDTFLANSAEDDLTDLEEVKCCRGGN